MSGNFELDGKGSIRVAPLVSYQTMTFAGMAVVVRLGYAESEEVLKTMSLQHVQLALTPAQCQELAEALLHAAANILGQSAGPLQG